MHSDTVIKEWIASIDLEKITVGLNHLAARSSLNFITELYESIWKMTYANATEDDFRAIDAGPLANKILLMNEQGDLIPSELVPIPEVTRLDLGGFPKAVFFPELLKYKGLKSLDFWENDLEILPESFFELTQLEHLYISVGLAELSPSIGKLTRLQELKLSGNCLTKIPSQVAQLSELKVLDLNSNWLESFDLDISALEKLEEINLIYNPKELVISEEVITIAKERGIELSY
ncbi:hypothetical protein BKI52_11135 [marine bacterium AO1-C]|nr:hypothetical protein BKI52_11135 [marine bacterium AO1-C]